MSLKKVFAAILMNVFVCPGAGQVFLKEKRRGLMFIIASALLLAGFSFQFYSIIQGELALLPKPATTAEIAPILEALKTRVYERHSDTIARQFYLFGVLYLVSIADVYFIFAKQKPQQTE